MSKSLTRPIGYTQDGKLYLTPSMEVGRGWGSVKGAPFLFLVKTEIIGKKEYEHEK